MFSVSQSTMDEDLKEHFIQKNYSDLFLGIGCLTGKHKIHLNEIVSCQLYIHLDAYL